MILKILAICAVILVSLELLLQLGALVVSASGRKMPAGWSTENTRVLAIGDSNTFGLYLDEQESYPSQLQALWNSRHPDRPIEVINMGYPGTNSYRVADIIEDVLASTKPDVVLLVVGINDMFTAAEYVESNPASGSDAGGFDPMTLVRRHSRLYKLVYIARQGIRAKDIETADAIAEEAARQGPAVKDRDLLQWTDDADERLRRVKEFKEANRGDSVQGETMQLGDKALVMVDEAPDHEGSFEHIRHNLAIIEEKASRKGVKLYLMTYAASAGLYGRANREISAYAASSPDLAFIDVAAEIGKTCPRSHKCPDLFFDDLHPKAKGYGMVAEIVAAGLEVGSP